MIEPVKVFYENCRNEMMKAVSALDELLEKNTVLEEKVCEKYEITRDKLKEYKKAYRKNNNYNYDTNLFEEIYKTGKNVEYHPQTWQERLLRDVTNNPEAGLYAPIDFEKSVEYVLNTLTDKEKDIITLVYKENKHLDWVGEKYNVSKSRIGQIVQKSLRKLRSPNRYDILMNGLAMADINKQIKEKEVEYEELLKQKQFKLNELNKKNRRY